MGATFGTNTRHSVPVVQKMMKTEMRTKEALGCSLRTAEMATPRTHMIVTLYTDIPTYLQHTNFIKYCKPFSPRN